MTPTAARAYVAGTIETVSPAQLLVLCYERCCRDLHLAARALDGGDLAAAHEQLLHAQEIVAELDACLDVDAWEHAGALRALYAFVTGRLVAANVGKVRGPVEDALAVLEPLRDTWRDVAAALTSESGGQVGAHG